MHADRTVGIDKNTTEFIKDYMYASEHGTNMKNEW